MKRLERMKTLLKEMQNKRDFLLKESKAELLFLLKFQKQDQ